MRFKILLPTVVLLLCGCATKTASIDPAQDIKAGLCNWEFTGSTNFEATTKGQGFAKNYKCAPLGNATIYRYTADRSNWTDGKDDLLSMLRMNNPGIVQAYKNNGVAVEPVVITAKTGQPYFVNGKNVLGVRYDLIAANGGKSTSFLFLTADAGEILKHRLTFAGDNKELLTNVSLMLLLASVPKAPTAAN